MAKPYMCGDDLPVYVPEGGCDCNYTLQRVETTESAAAYQLMLNGSQVGDLIKIPFDKYVENCLLEKVVMAEVPYAGAVVGDPYLNFSFSNTEEHIYVPLASIVGGGYKIVDSLPAEGDSRYIYLVESASGYDRYIWDVENSEWVEIGDTTIDLSDYYTKSQVDSMISNIMLRFYPIGSIYISTTSTNPGTVFGGTWQRIEDTFLLAAGSTHEAGETGGEETHTLSTNELPGHTHQFEAIFRTRGTTYNDSQIIWQGTNVTVTKSTTKGDGLQQISGMVNEYAAQIHGDTSLTGSGLAHNNMPPYLAVYVWKRTA